MQSLCKALPEPCKRPLAARYRISLGSPKAARSTILRLFDLAASSFFSIIRSSPQRPRIIFYTFADGVRYTCSRLANEVRDLDFFDEVHSLTAKDIGDELAEIFPRHMKSPIGFGYWIWKPFVLNKIAASLKEGDILIYVDAGSSTNRHTLSWLKALALELHFSSNDLIACPCHQPNRRWCKRRLIDEWPTVISERLLDSTQIEATRIALKISKNTKLLLSEWLRLGSRVDLIDETNHGETEDASFVSHRYDQSIYSFLAYQNGFRFGIEFAFDTTRLRH